MLREEWTGYRGTIVPVAIHVIEMREQLAEMAQLISEHAAKSQEKQRKYHDRSNRNIIILCIMKY